MILFSDHTDGAEDKATSRRSPTSTAVVCFHFFLRVSLAINICSSAHSEDMETNATEEAPKEVICSFPYFEHVYHCMLSQVFRTILALVSANRTLPCYRALQMRNAAVAESI